MFGIIPWLIAKGLSERGARNLAVMAGAVAAVLLLASLAGLWLRFHDRDVIAADRAGSNAKALGTARAADADAAAASDETRNDVEKANDDARDAARGSDDPLGDGLRSLRDKPPR